MFILLIGISYVCGAIPFGLLVGFGAKRIDVRQHGSGNIGATNVFRVVGKPWGILAFLLDFSKGLIPLIITRWLIATPAHMLLAAVAVASICGHNWPIFLKFKGGKGVATSLGAISGLSLFFPTLLVVVGLSVAAWVIVFMASRYVSLASLLAGVTFFLLSLIFNLPLALKGLALVLCVFIVVRHKSNIKKLLSGTEHRF